MRSAPEAQVSQRADTGELHVLPLISADSDRGIGFGALVAYSRLGALAHPYRWRLQLTAFAAARGGRDGGVELSTQKYRAQLDIPELWHRRLRIGVDARFSKSLDGYYGIGNASGEQPVAADAAPHGSDYLRYERMFVRLRALARLRLVGPLQLYGSASFTYDRLRYGADSKLAEDLKSGDARLIDLLRGVGRQAIGEVAAGLIYDTRDDEIAPSRGMFHEVSGRSGVSGRADLQYGGVNATLRFYAPLWRRRLVLAGRLMADFLFGHAPLTTLVRHGGLVPDASPGGGTGVRGVPRYRYAGKAKLLGNLELRARLWRFRVLSQRFGLGAVAFFDAGRVFADYTEEPRFDGAGLGLKIGAGGGLRLRWGRTFVVRFDVAWSPDASPVGMYLNVNHVF